MDIVKYYAIKGKPMNAVYLMIPFAVVLGFGFVVTFIFMASQGQYDDLDTPAHKILIDGEVSVSSINEERQSK